MPILRTHARSFAGGEISPELYGRLDLDKFQTGLATCKNFVILPHGPAENRAGFAYVINVKDSSKQVRIIPFNYNTEQTYAIEFGDLYVRFHTQGGTVLESSQAITNITNDTPGVVTYTGADPSNGDWVYLSGILGMTELNGRYVKVSSVNAGANTFVLTDLNDNVINTVNYGGYTSDGTFAPVYEIASPFAEADLFDLHYVQSADVLTIVHPSYAPRELRRSAPASWAFTSIGFIPSVVAPSNVDATISVGSGSVAYRYLVTSIAEETLEESLPAPESIEASKSITAITAANPGVITTSASHNLSVEDEVYIESIGGMVEIPDGNYYVNTVPTASTFSIKDRDNTVINSTGYTAYTSGGTVQKISTGVLNNLATTGNKNRISWDVVTGAVRYNVYKDKNGLYGYIGQTSSVTFVDENITADTTRTPPELYDPFDATNKYPAAVSYFEQRRWFAGTNTNPQTIWATRSATESNMSYSIPTQDDDSITVRIAARDVNSIRHIVPLSDLLLLTSGGEWRIMAQNSDVITPLTIGIKPQSFVGANNVQPVLTGNSVVYIQAQGSKMRDLSYNWESNAYRSEDLSLLASHLFEPYTIIDMAHQRAPDPIIWMVRSDGILLGLTYLPLQRIWAVHQHETDGLFESVCVVSEGNEDVLYAVINRTIDGETKRFVERHASRKISALVDGFFVDSGLTYDGTPTMTVSGLWHLEGETVSALADGAVVPMQVVTNGSITLEQDASLVHVGLPYNCDLKTLPVVYENVQAFGQGMVKNANAVYLRVYQSSGIKAGPDYTKLREYVQRVSEPYGSPPDWVSDEIEITLTPTWQRDGSVCVRQSDPLPLTVMSITFEYATGG